ncbi:class I SAM-dependent methyltransferase [Amycolatopsis solani]|uniref:class I SAM-dependent methyltransferase n=1 Tax=Amycolatopsis solani TaxID=3028615 RepID=UPI0025B26477|nr:class I SAM-dependent methyltransferase [Amycolatopsis sp. MEP2-6]
MTTDPARHPIALAQLLDLDGEVLQTYLADLTAWLASLFGRRPAHIIDLASGTGTGALALARQFPAASVTALELSPQLLHRLREQASSQGVGDRVRGIQADLDQPWPPMDGADLVWAASALHHLADPGKAFARAFQALRPGGWTAVTEMDFFPRLLPEDVGVGRPGLESRLHAALNTRPPWDWSGHLAAAGFVAVATRPFVVDLEPPLPPATGQYAHASLSRLRTPASGLLAADDLAALDVLLDPDHPLGVLRRPDLTVRTTRTTWVGRRP